MRFVDILDRKLRKKTDLPWLGEHAHDYGKYPAEGPLKGGHPGEHGSNKEWALDPKTGKFTSITPDTAAEAFHPISATTAPEVPKIPKAPVAWISQRAVRVEHPGSGIPFQKVPEHVQIAVEAIGKVIKVPSNWKRVSIRPTDVIENLGLEAQYLAIFNTINYDKDLGENPIAPVIIIHELGHAIEDSFLNLQGAGATDESILDTSEFAEVRAAIIELNGGGRTGDQSLVQPYTKAEAWADAWAQYIAEKTGLEQSLMAYGPLYDREGFHRILEPALDRVFAKRGLLTEEAQAQILKQEKDEEEVTAHNVGALAGGKRAFDQVPLPMIVQSEDKSAFLNPLDTENYIYQKKYDGTRAVIRIEDGHITEVRSRTGEDWIEKYPELDSMVERLSLGTTGEYVLDGEIVVFDEKGHTSIEMLQNKGKKIDPETTLVTFVAFDVLAADGEDLTSMELEDRLDILNEVVPTDDKVIQKAPVSLDGKALFDEFLAQEGEGIVAKLRGSTYEVGTRSDAWLKLKYKKEAEVVIGGYEVLPEEWTKGKLRVDGKAKVRDLEPDMQDYEGQVGTIKSVPKGWNPDNPELVLELEGKKQLLILKLGKAKKVLDKNGEARVALLNLQIKEIEGEIEQAKVGDFEIEFDDGKRVIVDKPQIIPPMAGKVGAVRLGVYDENGNFQYVGDGGAGLLRLGGGFMEPTKALLDESLSDESPFSSEGTQPSSNTQWLEPNIILTVGFQDITATGVLRQPKIIAQRTDKDASEVTMQQLQAGNNPASKRLETLGGKDFADLLKTDQNLWSAEIDGPMSRGYDPEGAVAEAVSEYVDRSWDIHVALRSGKTQHLEVGSDGIEGGPRDIIEVLDEYTASQTAPTDILIYRGLDSKVAIQVGDEIPEKSFTSWSLNQKIAGSYSDADPALEGGIAPAVLKMIFKRGSEFGAGDIIAQELILARDRKYKVTGTEHDNVTGITYATVEPVGAKTPLVLTPEHTKVPAIQNMDLLYAIKIQDKIVPVKHLDSPSPTSVRVEDQTGHKYTVSRNERLSIDTVYGVDDAKQRRAQLVKLFKEEKAAEEERNAPLEVEAKQVTIYVNERGPEGQLEKRHELKQKENIYDNEEGWNIAISEVIQELKTGDWIGQGTWFEIEKVKTPSGAHVLPINEATGKRIKKFQPVKRIKPIEDDTHRNFMARLGERIGDLTRFLQAQPGGFTGRDVEIQQKTDLPWLGEHEHNFGAYPVQGPFKGGHPGEHKPNPAWTIDEAGQLRHVIPETRLIDFGSWLPEPSDPQNRGSRQFLELEALHVQALQGLPPLDARVGWLAWIEGSKGKDRRAIHSTLAGKEFDLEDKARAERLIVSLDTNFRDTMPWPKDTIAYIPTNIDAVDVGEKFLGMEFTASNYVETHLFRREALTRSEPGKVVLRTIVPKGSKALFLNEYDGTVLLPHGSTFKVVEKHSSNDDGIVYWDVEVSEPSEVATIAFRDLSPMSRREQNNIIRQEAGMNPVPSTVSDWTQFHLEYANISEEKAEKLYASDEYRWINDVAREAFSLEAFQKELQRAIDSGDTTIENATQIYDAIDALDEYTQRGQLSETTRLYRGLEDDTFLREIGIGGTFEEKGFLSVSTSRKVAVNTFAEGKKTEAGPSADKPIGSNAILTEREAQVLLDHYFARAVAKYDRAKFEIKQAKFVEIWYDGRKVHSYGYDQAREVAFPTDSTVLGSGIHPSIIILEADIGTRFGPGYPAEHELILPRGSELEIVEHIIDVYDTIAQGNIDIWRIRLKQHEITPMEKPSVNAEQAARLGIELPNPKKVERETQLKRLQELEVHQEGVISAFEHPDIELAREINDLREKLRLDPNLEQIKELESPLETLSRLEREHIKVKAALKSAQKRVDLNTATKIDEENWRRAELEFAKSETRVRLARKKLEGLAEPMAMSVNVGISRTYEEVLLQDQDIPLSVEEQSSVTNYSLNGYKAINDYLKGEGETSPFVLEEVDHLDSAIAKNTLKESTILWRGVQAHLNAFQEGDTLPEEGFSSFSLEKDTARNFASYIQGPRGDENYSLIKLTAPKGINFTTGDITEGEVILSQNLTYRFVRYVDDAPDDISYWEVEIIGQEDQ